MRPGFLGSIFCLTCFWARRFSAPARRACAVLPSRSCRRTIFCEALSHLRCNLMIRHLVRCFNACDAFAQVLSFKTFLQLTLCLTGTEYQNGFRAADGRNYRIVVDVEMSRKGSLPAVVGRHLHRFIGTPEGRIAGTPELFFNRRYQQFYLFPFFRNSYDSRLPVVNPQTHFSSHRVLLCLRAPPNLPVEDRASAAQSTMLLHGL